MTQTSQYSVPKSELAYTRMTLAISLFIAIVFFNSGGHGFFNSIDWQDTGPNTWKEIATATERGDIPRRVALLSLGAFGILSLFLRARMRQRNRMQINGLLGSIIIIYILYAVSSITWSDDFNLTSGWLC